MHTPFQRILISCAAALLGLLSLGTAYADDCTPAHQVQTLTPGKLTVVTMSIPPFSIAENGTLSGVDGEIITRIAAMECLTLEPIVVDTRAVIQYVVTGQADVAVGNWYRTATRAQAVDYSNPIYLDGLGIFSKDGTQSLGDLLTRRAALGTVQGYNWVSDIQKMFGSAVKLYPSPMALAQDLEARRIDVGLDSYPGGLYARQQGGLAGFQVTRALPDPRVKATLEPAQIAFIHAKGNTAMGNMLDDNLAVLQNRGDIAAILTQYGFNAQMAEVGSPRLIE